MALRLLTGPGVQILEDECEKTGTAPAIMCVSEPLQKMQVDVGTREASRRVRFKSMSVFRTCLARI